ncbi:MAG: sigma-70 family RNA polymerase sigma factor [Sphingomonadaceae bacterium]|nr:sigma-70 family RNA polymerase sigma factor [Sphingomonadaceae bacterium]
MALPPDEYVFCPVTRGKRLFRPHLVFSATRPDRASDEFTIDQTSRFRDIILPHMDAAYNFARFLARDPVAAEDIVQEAFLRAFRGFHAFRGEAPKAWLLAIVRNCFLNWVKTDRTPRDMREAMEDVAFDCPAPPHAIDHDNPEAILLRRHDVETVRTTIENLPEPFREALVLRELEELSYQEIALLTDAPIGTVMSRLSRARQMLGQLLLPETGFEREIRP